jgi:BirA family biotin operon repressor/biotin-[acetyl-CoA-carboxylase] ligase
MSLPDDLWELPHRHVGHQVLVFRSVRSTNDIAATLADDLAHAGVAVLAEEQTAGRGQYGRLWQAPPGSSVLLSVLLFPPPQLRRASILTAWAASAVATTIKPLIQETPTIKWPNDVLVGGKKVCGVLIEQGRGVITGIGLNVNQSAGDFELAELPNAASLCSLTGKTFECASVARGLLAELDRSYDGIMRGRLADLEQQWIRQLGLLHHEVMAEMFNGTSVRGQLIQINFDILRIQRYDGGVIALRPEQIQRLTAVTD